MTTALVLFAITYVLLLSFQGVRHWIALCSALVFIVLGLMPLGGMLGAVISGYILIWLIWA